MGQYSQSSRFPDEEENGNDSMFSGLGWTPTSWTPTSCATLVSNDPALEKAVRDCFEKGSLDFAEIQLNAPLGGVN